MGQSFHDITKADTGDCATNTSCDGVEMGTELIRESVRTPSEIHTDSPAVTTAGAFVETINNVVKPPKPLSADDIYVREVALVSDARNQHGGRFPFEELQRITELVTDTPVLVGHRKDRLPIARIFHAELVQRDKQHWVKAWMYWLKEADGAETLRANIDGGVYKDCSLGFTFARAECSVCQEDIRFCGHTPVRLAIDPPYDDPDFDDSRDVFFYYRDVQRTLEVSLVYRGANPGARVGIGLEHEPVDATDVSSDVSSGVLSDGTHNTWLEQLTVDRVVRLAEFDLPDETTHFSLRYPLLDGLPLLVGRCAGQTVVLRDDGAPAPESLRALIAALCHDSDKDADADFLFYARLTGMRGKSKRSCAELIRFLEEDKGPVRSLKLRALSLLRYNSAWLSAETQPEFEDTLREYCADKRWLTVVRPLTTAKSINPGAETLSSDDDGHFTIIRRRRKHLIHAQVATSGAVEIPLLKNGSVREESLTVSPVNMERQTDTAGVVSVGFDGVRKDADSIRLINPRIVANYGRYHSPETLHCENDTQLKARLRNGVINILPERKSYVRAISDNADVRIIRVRGRETVAHGALLKEVATQKERS